MGNRHDTAALLAGRLSHAVAVEITKRSVSYHLMPLYMTPADVLPISENVRRRMQGKSCFDVTRVDEDLFPELADLTQRAVSVAETSPFAGS